MSYSVALDIGASFIKASRVGDDGSLLGEVVRRPAPVGVELDGPGSRVIPANDLLSAVRAVLADVDPGSEARLLAISNQMHGFVFVDRDLGAAYGPVTWQDQRGRESVPTVRESLGEDGVSRLGNELRSGIPLGTLAALRGQLDSVADCVVASIGDWVAWSIAGKAGPMHATNAAAMGLMDVEKGCWDTDALEAAGLHEGQMPEICDEVKVIDGRLAALTPIGDQQAALLGIGVGPAEISFNVATGAQVTRVAEPGSKTDVQVRPYFGGKQLHTVTHIPAGRALNAWLGLLTELAGGAGSLEEDWELVMERVAQRSGSGLQFNLALFDNADGDSGSVTSILEDDLTVGEFMGAALDRLAQSLAFHAERVGYGGVDTAVYSGGWLREGRTVGETLAELIPVPVRRHSETEDTLSGLGKIVAAQRGGGES